MSDLKTMKDLHYFYNEDMDNYSLIDADKIRQEAIKWVKHYRKEAEIVSKDSTRNIELSGLVAIGEWIKHFFNLTEEELK